MWPPRCRRAWTAQSSTSGDTSARMTRQRRLALAGGVALNTTANGRLLTSGTFDEIYVQPAAADDGAALGAALQRAAVAGEVVNRRFPPRSSERVR